MNSPKHPLPRRAADQNHKQVYATPVLTSLEPGTPEHDRARRVFADKANRGSSS